MRDWEVLVTQAVDYLSAVVKADVLLFGLRGFCGQPVPVVVLLVCDSGK